MQSSSGEPSKSSWMDKELFLKHHGDAYGAGGCGESAREHELERIRGQVYLDFAGAVPYSEVHLQAVHKRLCSQVIVNPHSAAAGDDSVLADEEARALTLAMCNASSDEFDVIFTSGATDAIKMVGDAFPWSEGGVFAYTQDNHNSVVGIREIALDHGARVCTGYLRTNQEGSAEFVTGSEPMRRSSALTLEGSSMSLLAYPMESNFTGARYDLSFIELVKSHGLLHGLFSELPDAQSTGQTDQPRHQQWYILLDAAKACGSCPPDLSQFPADFTVLSFYKIFGYPSGLGALVVRKSALEILKPMYFGGGTIASIVPTEDVVVRKKGHGGWEHGTTNFLSIAALSDGFRSSDQRCNPGIASLCQSGYFAGVVGQGPVVAFNLLSSKGQWVGFTELHRLAQLHSIRLRVGRFCNYGAWALLMSVSAEDTLYHHSCGHVCGDKLDLIDGKPTGAIRVSLGWCSTFDDLTKFLALIQDYFVESSEGTNSSWRYKNDRAAVDYTLSCNPSPGEMGFLRRIYMFPVKSCGAQVVDSWPVTPSGILYDRHWAIVDSKGKLMTLSRYPELVLIVPRLSPDLGELTLSHPKQTRSIRIAFQVVSSSVDGVNSIQTTSDLSSPGITEWLASILRVKCSLATNESCQMGRQENANVKAASDVDTGFKNSGGVSLLSSTSMQRLSSSIDNSGTSKNLHSHRFRMNLIVDTFPMAPSEMEWKEFRVGQCKFRNRMGCRRCDVVMVNHETGQKDGKDIFLAITRNRTSGGATFGVIVDCGETYVLSVGDTVAVDRFL